MFYRPEIHSTSSWLRENYSEQLPHLYTVRTDYQTAGRGQAGNSWESEAGKNLLCSTLLRHHDLLASEQWRISMMISLAAREAISWVLHGIWGATINASTGLQRDTRWTNEICDMSSIEVTIKWPNDIYCGDKKLAGILIENMLMGRYISNSIVGIGINVNQTIWRSDAPNPISMKQITGEDYDIDILAKTFLSAIERWEKKSYHELHKEYMSHMYRRKGWHLFLQREVSIEPTSIAPTNEPEAFEACIVDITKQGELILQTRTRERKKYHFKEIRFCVEEHKEH